MEMEHERLARFLREERPWGNYERFTENEPTTVKILSVRAGEAFSLQTHAHRDEFWRVLAGSGKVTVGPTTTDAREGDEFYIARGVAHRAFASEEGLRFLEISFGDFDEADTVRLEDKYGRA